MVSRCGVSLDLAEQFRGRGLVEARRLFQAENADRLEQAQGPQGIGVGGVFGSLEADLDMALGRQVVDLVGLELLDQADQVGGVRHDRRNASGSADR